MVERSRALEPAQANMQTENSNVLQCFCTYTFCRCYCWVDIIHPPKKCHLLALVPSHPTSSISFFLLPLAVSLARTSTVEENITKKSSLFRQDTK
jgi:hypothetical protein